MHHEEATALIARITKIGPDRVLVNAAGEAKPLGRAKLEDNVVPEVIFIREDGWSLGAPLSLENEACLLWQDEWVIVMHQRPNNWSWRRYTGPKGDSKRPWTMPSVTRQVFPATLVPVTKAEDLIPIATALLRNFEAVPASMHPSFDNAGEADIRKLWHPFLRSIRTLREGLGELEESRKKGNDDEKGIQ